LVERRDVKARAAAGEFELETSIGGTAQEDILALELHVLGDASEDKLQEAHISIAAALKAAVMVAETSEGNAILAAHTYCLI